jgi:uncharacterized protein (TIGR02391 family)
MNGSADMASLVPAPNTLLELDREEQGKLLLKLLLPATPEFPVAHSNFFNRANDFANPPKYGARQREVDRALLEAWSWLETRGFLAIAPTGHGSWFFVSNAGKEFLSQSTALANFDVVRLLPREALHPKIADAVRGAFMRSEFDVAAFQALKAVEVSVRTAAGFGAELIGVNLMRRAFSPEGGPLTDMAVERGERTGRMELFAGTIGSYKNPQSHRDVNLEDPYEAMEIIFLANHLLRIVDARIKANSGKSE